MRDAITLTPEQKELLNRIQEFHLDDAEAGFPFHARLARDNGWSSGYTSRVISEYRKFIFLAVVAGHPVTPSDQVDQAWHLHLLYTDSYWRRLCKEVLGKPLHHGPTKGGTDEKTKFGNWYHNTLASYRRYLGIRPPEDIWPDPKIRFGEDIHYQRVNVQRCWILPKVWVTRVLLVASASLFLTLLLSFVS